MARDSYTGGSTVISTGNVGIRSVSSLINATKISISRIKTAEKALLEDDSIKKKLKNKYIRSISAHNSLLKKLLPELLTKKKGKDYLISIISELNDLENIDKNFLNNIITKLRDNN